MIGQDILKRKEIDHGIMGEHDWVYETFEEFVKRVSEEINKIVKERKEFIGIQYINEETAVIIYRE